MTGISHNVAVYRYCTGKGKGHPKTGREGPEGEYWHNSTLSLTSALGGVGCQLHAPGQVWKGAENLANTGIRSPVRPARSESLYRLSCPGPHVLYSTKFYV
jgi:hypothetical protein